MLLKKLLEQREAIIMNILKIDEEVRLAKSCALRNMALIDDIYEGLDAAIAALRLTQEDIDRLRNV